VEMAIQKIPGRPLVYALRGFGIYGLPG
jgi:hypothetical protein